jgi:hypothetical protein
VARRKCLAHASAVERMESIRAMDADIADIADKADKCASSACAWRMGRCVGPCVGTKRDPLPHRQQRQHDRERREPLEEVLG